MVVLSHAGTNGSKVDLARNVKTVEGFFPPAITAGKSDYKNAQEPAITQMASTRG